MMSQTLWCPRRCTASSGMLSALPEAPTRQWPLVEKDLPRLPWSIFLRMINQRRWHGVFREDHHRSQSLREVHNSFCGCCSKLAVGMPGCCFGPSVAEPVDGFSSQDSTVFRDTSDGTRPQSALRGDHETQRATGASWWSFSQLQESSSTWYCSVQVCVESWPELQQTSRCWCQGKVALL